MCSHEGEVEGGAAPGREDETTPRQREEIPGGYIGSPDQDSRVGAPRS